MAAVMMSTKAAAEVAPAAALTTETREEALTGGVPMGAVPTESRGGISPKAEPSAFVRAATGESTGGEGTIT
tara:strand:- start:229 stop:444 length:216 start_codon:yes stop_codon:yes gene_type:complete